MRARRHALHPLRSFGERQYDALSDQGRRGEGRRRVDRCLSDLSILCTAEDSGEVAAERFAACLVHLIEAHTDGVLEGWTVIVSPVVRGERGAPPGPFQNHR